MTMSGNATMLPGEAIYLNPSCPCIGVQASDYRLECLKLAFKHHQDIGAFDGDVVDVADELSAFVMRGLPPVPTQLYVIENREEPKDSEAAEKRFLSIAGSYSFWTAEHCAYRFRSFDEASAATIKFHPIHGGDMTIVPLPLGTELF